MESAREKSIRHGPVHKCG
ncbi:hypothetical protein [Laspinema palackyanum]